MNKGGAQGQRSGGIAADMCTAQEAEMATIADFIDRVLRARGDAWTEASVRADVAALTNRFPLYPEHLA